MGVATFTTNFTATGTGQETQVKFCDKVNYAVTGTFVGTWEIQQSTNALQSFEVVDTGTGAGSGVFENTAGSDAYLRFACTAFTSGTVETSMVEQPKVSKIFKDLNGATIMTVTEAGVNITGVMTATSVAGTFVFGTLIPQAVDTGSVELTGDDAVDQGGNLKLYGASHATKADDFELRDGSTIILGYDKSVDELTATTQDFFVEKSIAADRVQIKSSNTDNTSIASHAELFLNTGGASGGDPKIRFNISGVGAFSMGRDNTDSGIFKLSADGAVGTNTRLSFDGTGLSLFGVAPVARPTAFTQTFSTASKTHSNPTAASLTDNSGGTPDQTVQALTDPADAPATADILRDDLSPVSIVKH